MTFNPLFTALVTPFNSNFTIDYKSLDLLIDRQEEAGNELLILGSTGEGLAMPKRLKEELLIHVGRRRSGFMVGVGGHNLEEQKEWIDFALKQRAGSFLLVTPYYSRPGKEGQLHWFQSLMDHAKAPCMLYNIPKRAGTSLNQETLYALKNHPHLFAVKEASGSLEEFRLLKKAAPELLFYAGNDDMMFELAHLGAEGLVAVMSNVAPEATRNYLTASLKGVMNDLIATASEAATILSQQNPLSIKIALERCGLIAFGDPLPPLNRHDHQNLHEIDRALQLLRVQRAEERRLASHS